MAIFVLLFWKTSLSAMYISQSLFYFSGRPVYLPCTSANLCFTFLEDQSICHVLQPIFVYFSGRPVYLPYSSANLCLLFWKTSLSAIFFSQSLFYFSGRPVYLPCSSANLCYTFLEDQSICHVLKPIFVLLFWKTSLSAMFFSQSLFYFSGRPVYLPYSSANLCFTFLEDQSICHILQPIRQVVTEDVLTLVCCILAV